MAEILDELERRFPGLKGRILNDQGQVHHHVQLFIGDRWLEDRQGLSDRIAPSDEVLMIEAVSGG